MSNFIKVTMPTTELNGFLEEYTNIVDRAKTSALRSAANVLKKAAKSGLSASGINIGHNPIYNDTLMEGIRTTKPRDYGDWIGIHILGSRAKGSGTFRLRFFELGTKERYAKTYKGKPLKKKHRLGKIDPSKFAFFERSVDGAQSNAVSAFQTQLQKYIDNAWNNG